MPSLDPIVYGNSVLKWLIALIVFLFVLFGLVVLRRILISRISDWAKKRDSDFDDFVLGLIRRTKNWFLLIASFALASLYLELSHSIFAGVRSVFIVGLLIQFGFWGEDTIRFFLLRILEQKESKRGGHDPALQTTISALQFVCRFGLYILILLLILDNLGFNVTTLIAGLGVGGIAVALAAQNILGDLFASLSIVIDKPFVLGDYIEVGAQKGRVEKIGLKTTRIRSVTGELIIMSNTDLLHSRILNFARMPEKRVTFSLGVSGRTDSVKLKRIPDLVRKIIEQQNRARFDFAYFKSFGDAAFVFEVAYFILSSSRDDYIATEQSINLAIVEMFQREGLEFALPTRTLIMEKTL
jgi:small-conductance mechanosensitive channel